MHWRKGDPTRTASLSAVEADAAPLDGATNGMESRGNVPATEETPLDEDGPNPLPPALEPEKTSAAETGEHRSPARPPAGTAKKARRPSDPEPGAEVAVPETYVPISLAAGTPAHPPQGPAASSTKPTVSEDDPFAVSDSGEARPRPDGLENPSPAGASPPQASSRTSDPFETQARDEAPVAANAGAAIPDAPPAVSDSRDPFAEAVASDASAISLLAGNNLPGQGAGRPPPIPEVRIIYGSAGATPSQGTENSAAADPFLTPEPQPRSEPAQLVAPEPQTPDLGRADREPDGTSPCKASRQSRLRRTDKVLPRQAWRSRSRSVPRVPGMPTASSTTGTGASWTSACPTWGPDRPVSKTSTPI